MKIRSSDRHWKSTPSSIPRPRFSAAAKTTSAHEVNTQCCPICIGMPGTLPTLNKKVVEYAVRMGHACGCTINRVRPSRTARTTFIPTCPRPIRSRQYDIPLCENGEIWTFMLDGRTNKTVRHHAASTSKRTPASCMHDDRFSGSLVDFNRCGVPLIEIVSRARHALPRRGQGPIWRLSRRCCNALDISNCKHAGGLHPLRRQRLHPSERAATSSAPAWR